MDLSERGAAMWASLDATFDLTGSAGVLALEACRCADRLERLNEAVSNSDILDLPPGVLAEARQQQLALRVLLTTLGVAKPKDSMKEATGLDDLAAGRAARIAKTARPKSPAVQK